MHKNADGSYLHMVEAVGNLSILFRNFLSMYNYFCKKIYKKYYLQKKWNPKKGSKGMCYFYIWWPKHSFIHSINLSSVVNIIEWINTIYISHYHHGKKFTDFHTNDLAAEPVEILFVFFKDFYLLLFRERGRKK